MYACIDIDAPIGVQIAKGGGGFEPSSEQIGMLADMGFSTPQARKALRETVCGLNAVHAYCHLTDKLTLALSFSGKYTTCRTETQSVP